MTDSFIIAEYFDLLNKTLQDLNLLENPESDLDLELGRNIIVSGSDQNKSGRKKYKPCARTTYGSG